MINLACCSDRGPHMQALFVPVYVLFNKSVTSVNRSRVFFTGAWLGPSGEVERHQDHSPTFTPPQCLLGMLGTVFVVTSCVLVVWGI